MNMVIISSFPQVPNRIVNIDGGATFLFGDYDAGAETFTPWRPHGEKPGVTAHLDVSSSSGWWGTQMTSNGRALMIGWAHDYHGNAGPGITFLTRLTLLREIHFDPVTSNLVSNPVPELVGLRTTKLASERAVALIPGQIYPVKGTGNGAAASADVLLTFDLSGVSADAPAATFGACVLANSTFTGLGLRLTVSNDTLHAELNYCQVGASGIVAVSLYGSKTVSVRITPDRSVADFFVEGGRWSGTEAWPLPAARKAADSRVALWTSTAGVTADVDVYQMGCGWANPSYTTTPTL